MSAYVSTDEVLNASKSKSNIFPIEIRKPLLDYWKYRLLGLLALVVFSLIFFIREIDWVFVLLWVVGLVVGWGVFEIDYLLRFGFYNSDDNNILAKNNLLKGDGKLFWKLFISEMNSKPVGVIRSVLFQVVVGLLSLYIIFSSNSLFAKGLILAIGGRIVFEQLFDWLGARSVDNWFWQIDMEVSKQFKDLWVWGWLLIWFALVWWMI